MAIKNQEDVKTQKRLGERLKRILEASGIKSAQLAREAGVAHLSEIIKGTKPINWKVLKAISDNPALGQKAVSFILSEIPKDPQFALANFKEGMPDREEIVAAGTKLDAELLSEIIEAVEEYLEKQERILRPNLKAKAIGLLYLHFMESEKPVKESQDTIKSYLKLVA